MASTPQYAAVPVSKGVVINTANPNRDGTGTLALLFPASPTGGRIDDVSIVALTTTTAGMIRFFVKVGASYFLRKEIPVQAVVPSATSEAFSVEMQNLAWCIEPNAEVYVSTEKAEPFAVLISRGGSL